MYRHASDSASLVVGPLLRSDAPSPAQRRAGRQRRWQSEAGRAGPRASLARPGLTDVTRRDATPRVRGCFFGEPPDVNYSVYYPSICILRLSLAAQSAAARPPGPPPRRAAPHRPRAGHWGAVRERVARPWCRRATPGSTPTPARPAAPALSRLTHFRLLSLAFAAQLRPGLSPAGRSLTLRGACAARTGLRRAASGASRGQRGEARAPESFLPRVAARGGVRPGGAVGSSGQCKCSPP